MRQGKPGACSYAVGDCVRGHCTFRLLSAQWEFAPSFLPRALKTSLHFGLQRRTNSWRASGEQDRADPEVKLCCFEPSGSQAPRGSRERPARSCSGAAGVPKGCQGTQEVGEELGSAWGWSWSKVPGSGHWGSATGLVRPAQPQRGRTRVGRPGTVQRLSQSEQQGSCPCPLQPGVAWEHLGLAAAPAKPTLCALSCSLLNPFARLISAAEAASHDVVTHGLKSSSCRF